MLSTWKPHVVHRETTWYPHGNQVLSTEKPCGVNVVTTLCPHVYKNHIVSMYHVETMLFSCGHNMVTMLTPHGFQADTTSTCLRMSSAMASSMLHSVGCRILHVLLFFQTKTMDMSKTLFTLRSSGINYDVSKQVCVSSREAGYCLVVLMMRIQLFMRIHVSEMTCFLSARTDDSYARESYSQHVLHVSGKHSDNLPSTPAVQRDTAFQPCLANVDSIPFAILRKKIKNFLP